MADVERRIRDLRGLSWDERASSSGTAGTYLKARSGTGSRMTYYKLSRYNGLEIDGHECVNEVVACRLMDALGIPHLPYRLVHARILLNGEETLTWLNASMNYRKVGERKQGLGVFYELRKEQGESPLDFCDRMGWLAEVRRMMLVDYLIINRDRHASNIEVLVGRDGVARLAPIFDNGLSLVAPLAGNIEAIRSFDPLRHVATMNFLGSRDLEENLETAIPIEGIGELREGDRESLLDGLDEAVPVEVLDKIWEIVWTRWRHYEDIRDHR